MRPQQPCETGERPVDLTRREVLCVERMQLVVERPDPLRQHHVLSDMRQISRVLGRTVEGLDKVGGDLARAG